MRLVETPIRAVWPFVRQGLEQVAAKVPVEWRPEDVYAECLSGAAWLYLPKGPEPEGFIVLKPQVRPYSGARDLLVWIMWSQARAMMAEYNEDFEAIARVHGFDYLTLWSPRPGFEKLSNQLPGWEKQTVVYERKLT